MQKKTSTVVIASVLVIAIAIFIVRDFRKATIFPVSQPTTDQTQNNSSPGVKVAPEGGVKDNQGGLFEVVSTEGQPKLPLPPAPNLDRPLVFRGDLSAETKNQISIQVLELTGLLKKNPDSLGNWLNLGALWKMTGDYEGAIAAWDYAGAIRPLNYVSFGNLGDLYQYYLKDYPKAEKNMLLSIKNGPNNIAGYRALVDLYTQSYTDKLGLVPGVLTDGLKKNTDNYDLLVMLASYYKNAGDKANAILYYNKAITTADSFGQSGMKQALLNEIKSLNQ